jgi:hypothetical protein
MEYIVFVRIDGEWREVARIEAADPSDAIRKGELAMPPEFKGRAMGLKSMGGVACETAVQPKCCQTDETEPKLL